MPVASHSFRTASDQLTTDGSRYTDVTTRQAATLNAKSTFRLPRGALDHEGEFPSSSAVMSLLHVCLRLHYACIRCRLQLPWQSSFLRPPHLLSATKVFHYHRTRGASAACALSIMCGIEAQSLRIPAGAGSFHVLESLETHSITRLRGDYCLGAWLLPTLVRSSMLVAVLHLVLPSRRALIKCSCPAVC